MALSSRTTVLLKLGEWISVATAIFYLGYQVAQWRESVEENTKKIQVLFKICWFVRDQESFVDKFKGMNPESRSKWPDPKEIHNVDK